jgi:hypothetical protein
MVRWAVKAQIIEKEPDLLHFASPATREVKLPDPKVV